MNVPTFCTCSGELLEGVLPVVKYLWQRPGPKLGEQRSFAVDESHSEHIHNISF